MMGEIFIVSVVLLFLSFLIGATKRDLALINKSSIEQLKRKIASLESIVSERAKVLRKNNVVLKKMLSKKFSCVIRRNVGQSIIHQTTVFYPSGYSVTGGGVDTNTDKVTIQISAVDRNGWSCRVNGKSRVVCFAICCK